MFTPVFIWLSSNQHGAGTERWEGKPWNLGLPLPCFQAVWNLRSAIVTGRWQQPCGYFLAYCFGCTGISSRVPLSEVTTVKLTPLIFVPKMLNKYVLMYFTEQCFTHKGHLSSDMIWGTLSESLKHWSWWKEFYMVKWVSFLLLPVVLDS